MKLGAVVQDHGRTLRDILMALDLRLTAEDNFAPAGVSGQVLTSQGPNTPPSWQTIPSTVSSAGINGVGTASYFAFWQDEDTLTDGPASYTTGVVSFYAGLNVRDASTFQDALTVSGVATLNGNVVMGDAITDTITFTGRVTSNIVPLTNATYTLGLAAGPFLWLSGHFSSFVQIGTTVSATGAVRLANATYTAWRNAANTQDVLGIGLNSSDQVDIGGSNSTAVRLNPGGTVYVTIASNIMALSEPVALTFGNSGYIQIGSTLVATIGTFRTRHNSTAFVSRNSANSANFTFMQYGTAGLADALHLTGSVGVTIGSNSASVYWRVDASNHLYPFTATSDLGLTGSPVRRGYFTNVSMRGLDYVWPAADAAGVLQSDGLLGLSWGLVAPSSLSGFGAAGGYLRSDAAAWVRVTISSILADLLTVDGSGSGLDADLLDGQHGAYYNAAANLTGTTLPAAIVTSSLTTIGTLVAGAVPANLVTPGTFTGAYNFALGAAEKFNVKNNILVPSDDMMMNVVYEGNAGAGALMVEWRNYGSDSLYAAAANCYMIVTSAAVGDVGAYAFYSYLEANHPSGNAGAMFGCGFEAYILGAGTTDLLEGAYAYASIELGAGTTGSLIGFASHVNLSAAVTVPEAIGIWIDSNSKTAGTLTVNYGLKIEDQTVGDTDYAIHTGLGLWRTADQIVSALATGTAPFAVTSTTKNENLNADYVDGQHADTIPFLLMGG